MTIPSLDLPTERRWQPRRIAFLRVLADRPALLTVASAFLLTRLIAFFVVFVSSVTIPMRPGTMLYASPDNLLFDGLIRDDAWWYATIALRGYSMSSPGVIGQDNVAFFPLYPLIVRFVTLLVGNVYMAGLLVSNVAFLIALGYIYRLAQREWDDATASRAVWYVAGAPTAIFFASMYTESLFVACVAATFFYAREGRWWRAAIAGALGAATRNTGVLLALVIALEGLQAAGFHWRPRGWSVGQLRQHVGEQMRALWSSRSRLVAAAFATLGLIGYMAYLANAFGDPLAFVHVQAAWGRDISGAGITRIVSDTPGQLALGSGFWAGQMNIYLVLDAIFAIGFGGLIIATAFRFRPAYAVFAALTFLAPLASGTIGSMTRYVLMLLPCYLLLACWGRRPWVDRLVTTICLPLFAYFTVVFSHWYFAG
jgi:hypothetical protein